MRFGQRPDIFLILRLPLRAILFPKRDFPGCFPDKSGDRNPKTGKGKQSEEGNSPERSKKTIPSHNVVNRSAGGHPQWPESLPFFVAKTLSASCFGNNRFLPVTF